MPQHIIDLSELPRGESRPIHYVRLVSDPTLLQHPFTGTVYQGIEPWPFAGYRVEVNGEVVGVGNMVTKKKATRVKKDVPPPETSQ